MIDLVEPGATTDQGTAQTAALIKALYNAMSAHSGTNRFSDYAVINALGSLLVWACNRTKCPRAAIIAGLEREIKQ